MKRALWVGLSLLLLVPGAFAQDEAAPPAEEKKPAAVAEEAVVEETVAEEAVVKKAVDEEDGLEAAVESYTRLAETFVTAARREEPLYDVPRAVTDIPRDQIVMQRPRHAIDAITRRDAGVVMDMRTTTTGDPIMRGFAGFNILALIDGNTLSTLWGEGGFGADDMYGKVDTETIDKIEIVRGPGSVLYGSNALGGVINFITRSSPIDYTDGELEYGARSSTTYMSNNDGWKLRGEIYGATDTVKGLYGVTYGDYEDGKSADERLDPTRGEEINFDLRTDWLVAPGHEVTVSVLHVYRSPTYRYYRPTQDNKNERWGGALTWRADELGGFMKDFEWTGYYQYKRDQRRFKDTGKNGFARTVTWSTDVQASSDLPYENLITYGLHASVDKGEAPDDEQFKFTKPKRRSDSPDSRWANYAVFLQDEYEMLEDCVTVTGAVRYDYFAFNSEDTFSYRPEDGDREADFFRDTEDSWTGGVAVTYKPDEKWRGLGSWSRGFRQFAPNFGFRQLGNGVLLRGRRPDAAEVLRRGRLRLLLRHQGLAGPQARHLQRLGLVRLQRERRPGRERGRHLPAGRRRRLGLGLRTPQHRLSLRPLSGDPGRLHGLGQLRLEPWRDRRRRVLPPHAAGPRAPRAPLGRVRSGPGALRRVHRRDRGPLPPDPRRPEAERPRVPGGPAGRRLPAAPLLRRRPRLHRVLPLRRDEREREREAHARHREPVRQEVPPRAQPHGRVRPEHRLRSGYQFLGEAMRKPRDGRTAVAISIAGHLALVAAFWSTLWIATRSPEVVAEIASEVAPFADLEEPIVDQPRPELPEAPAEPVDPAVLDSEPPAEEPFVPLTDPRPTLSEIAVPSTQVAAIRRTKNLRRPAPPAEAPTPPPIAVSVPRGPTRRAMVLPGNPAPRYPARAVRLSLQGTVLLVAYVSVGGNVEKLEVRQSSGHDVLDRAALDTVEGWSFSPALANGARVPARVEVPVRFALR
jgi:protein TonB